MFKMLMQGNLISAIKKIQKSIPLIADFITTHPQFLYQMREYAEKTGRTAEFLALIEAIMEIMQIMKTEEEKEGKNG
jgi:hypothetical protein